ncbi:MAG: tetratricopeptide repeat protein [Proteobacteria bacterium]|nr:tetratricopeptide repeat protein [Pseudomonadota bacterium]MBU1688491.1 tetratricopeptide repeat protein [Pseudomonadota bacterium]
MSQKLIKRKTLRKKKAGRSGGVTPPSAAVLFDTALRFHEAGNTAEAERYYREVLALAPGFIDAWNNLGIALWAQGRHQEAESIYRQGLLVAPKLTALHHNLGLVLKDLGRWDEAIFCYQTAISLDYKYADPLVSLGQLQREQGRLDLAEQAFQKALSIIPGFPPALTGLGFVAHDQGDFSRAIELYRSALAANPHSPEINYNLGVVARDSGDLIGAERYYLKVLAVAPTHANAANNLAVVYGELGRFDQAERYYQKALALAPADQRTRTNYAELLEKSNRLDQAERLVDEILSGDPENLPGRRLKATLLRRRGDLGEALIVLSGAVLPEGNSELATEILAELGKLYDRNGNPGEAIRCFTEMKRLQSGSRAAQVCDPRRFSELVDRIDRVMTPTCIAEKREMISTIRSEQPIFLVGFPRSGTTLIDQILDSHPRLRVAEESPVLDQVISLMEAEAEGYPEVMTTCSIDDLARWGDEYLRLLEKQVPGVGNALIIDKYPLHLVHLGLIAMLFPKAKIILAIRHPYDVCLSNFMQLFTLNDAMANFDTLENAAQCYDRVMTLWRHAQQIPGLDVHSIRYEDLVADFEPEVRRLLNFLGVDWDEAVLGYDRHALSRERIFTPSYQQVTEKIYTRAAGRWEKYQDHLAPVRELLSPHAAAFGYDRY